MEVELGRADGLSFPHASFLHLSMREKISYWLPMSYKAFPSCSRRSRAIICRFYLCSPFPSSSLSPLVLGKELRSTMRSMRDRFISR